MFLLGEGGDVIANSAKHFWGPYDGAVPSFPALRRDTVILFQGDSITEACRDKSVPGPNDGFAWGAANAFLAHRSCSRHLPGRRLRIYNRGVSGDKVTTMAGRWEKDTIALKPDFITILVA